MRLYRLNNFMIAVGLVMTIPAGLAFAQNDTLPERKPVVADTTVFKEFKTEYLSDDKRLSEDASILVRKGDRLFERGPMKYEEALDQYLLAHKTNPENAFLNYKVGSCYLKIPRLRTHATLFLRKSQFLNKRVDPEILYEIGLSYQYNELPDSALNEYKDYIEAFRKANASLPPEQVEPMLKNVYDKIQECKNALALRKNPVRVTITNLGDSVNTPYPEYDPFVSADDSVMIFTTRRKETKGGGKALTDAEYYEDVFISHKEKEGWGKASHLEYVNKKTNDAVVGLSFDGQRMFIYRDTEGGDLYLCKLHGETWSKAKKIKAINSEFQESSAALSFDGKTLYFSSDRPGGYGGSDIYISRLIKKRKWSAPVNAGPVINSAKDESRVFIHPDGKTMYFSSRGHNGMGGYDIFKSVKKDTTWSKPENLGYPINSCNDEISFMMMPDGKKAYFSSSRPGGNGYRDLYMIRFMGPEKQGVINTEDNLLSTSAAPKPESVIEAEVEVRENKVTILKGIVKDAITLVPLRAVIEISDNEKNENIATFESNEATGKFIISLPSGVNYGIAVKAKDYLFHSENIIIPASSEYQEVEKEILLKKLDIGNTIVLKNIFFDFDKATLRPESFSELDRLVKLLNDHPEIKIEIAGHTDNVGSAEYNQALSEKRASSVVDYLVSKGINKERLQFAGYGLTIPIASNDTEDGKQKNRRTEFKVTGNDFKGPGIVKQIFNFGSKK